MAASLIQEREVGSQKLDDFRRVRTPWSLARVLGHSSERSAGGPFEPLPEQTAFDREQDVAEEIDPLGRRHLSADPPRSEGVASEEQLKGSPALADENVISPARDI